MKALCKTKPAAGAEYKEVDIPSIERDELLVKIYKTSICGSDLPVYNYTGWAPKRIPIPFIFGHELDKFLGHGHWAGGRHLHQLRLGSDPDESHKPTMVHEHEILR